ncbi:FCGR2 protein, partial [Dasyornis broadbenti]|nr:FCGR2 protein [Dasyornis broadbenti]
CPPDWLVLQVPTWAQLEGDTLKLCCQVWQNTLVTVVRFYHDRKYLLVSLRVTELCLLPLKMRHGGHCHFGRWVGPRISQQWEESVPMTVTVHGEQPSAGI